MKDEQHSENTVGTKEFYRELVNIAQERSLDFSAFNP